MKWTRIPLLALVALACASPPPVSPIRVIAHRGASAYAPENTLPAIARALARGTQEIELDVQLASDGVAMLFHDARLAEKTNAPGRIADHSSTALRPLDIGHWFDRTHPGMVERFAGTGLASLDEAFHAFRALPVYHLELKSTEPELVEAVVADVRAHHLSSRVWLTSFHAAQLEQARRLAPELPRCHLIERHRLAPTTGEPRHRAAIAAAAKSEARMVGIAAAELTRGLVEQAHGLGLEIRAWKVKSLEDWRRVVALGVDGGTVDWPDLALRALRESPRTAAAHTNAR